MTTSDRGTGRQSDVAAEITEIPSDDIMAVSVLVGADGTVTLTVVGEVDAFTAPRLRPLIASQLESQPRELVLDLSAVEFLGSAGLAVLVETQTLARDRGVAGKVVYDAEVTSARWDADARRWRLETAAGPVVAGKRSSRRSRPRLGSRSSAQRSTVARNVGSRW